MRSLDLVSPKRLLRPDEVAQLLALSRRTVYRMIQDGRLKAFRWGGSPWRIPRESLADLVGAVCDLSLA
jgi:excisionase family DNA binding protein